MTKAMKELKRMIKGYTPTSDKWHYWVLRDILQLLSIIKRILRDNDKRSI